MADIKSVLRGLEILSAQCPTAGEVDAQHDELFCSGPPPDQMPADVAAELEQLGWDWCREFECWRKFT